MANRVVVRNWGFEIPPSHPLPISWELYNEEIFFRFVQRVLEVALVLLLRLLQNLLRKSIFSEFQQRFCQINGRSAWTYLISSSSDEIYFFLGERGHRDGFDSMRRSEAPSGNQNIFKLVFNINTQSLYQSIPPESYVSCWLVSLCQLKVIDSALQGALRTT